MTKSNSKKRAAQKVFSGAALFSLALGASISAVPVTVPQAYAVENIDYTNPDSLSGVSGTWHLPTDTGTVGTTTERLDAAANEAYIKNNDVTVPAGYIADPVDGRETFGIVLLDELNDTNADYNERNGVNYYVTSSADRNIGPGTIFVNLVDKNTNTIVRSFELNEGDANVPLGLTDALSPQLGDSFFTLNYDVTYAADGSVAGREFRVKSAAGSDANHITIILNKANPSGEGAASNAPVVQVPTPATQTASYKVVGTHELLARYTQTGGYTGDLYAIAGPVTFDKYELVESPTLSADAKILATDYALGVTADTIQSNTRRTRTVVEPDGSIVVKVYYLNPESPNLATLYGKDTANGGNALSDATNEDDWKLMYESQPIAPDSWNSVASEPKVHSWEVNGEKYSYRAVVTNYDDLSATGLLSTTAGLVSDPTYARVANDQRPAKALGIDDFRVGGFNWSLRNGNARNEQHVTYWYAPKGDVDVYYVDENGNEIKAKNDLVSYGATDSAYDATSADVKPQFITGADGKVYEYVKVDTDGLRPVTEGKEGKDEHGRTYAAATSETGTVQQNTVQELTYVYKEVKSSVTVNYVDTEGNVIKDSVVDTTDASVGSSYDTNDNKPTEITVDGVKYVLVPSKTTAQVGTNDPVKSDGTGTVAQDPTQVTYVYQKVGSWVPQIPGVPVGEEPKIEYPFDPENPDQPITPTPDNVIPYVPGYTPVDPNTNDPLVPVDPNDESKGYIPPTTTTPGNDTFIPYVEKDRGSVVVNFIDTKGNIIQAPVTDENSVYVDTPYDTTDQKKDTITVTNPDGSETEYRLVRTDGNETGKVVEGVTSVTYVYEKVEYGTVVVNYVDTKGNVIKTQVEDTARTETGAAYDTTDNKPAEITTEDGSRYVLVPSKTEGTETGTVVAGETAVTYVYQKVASWIPQLPDGSTPEIPYPFDPNNPDQPVTPTPDTVIPYVPGYTPEDPNGEPLKPVDPEDPSKGYIPPTPSNPGEDTIITYVKDQGSVVVKYVDEAGNEIQAPATDTATTDILDANGKPVTYDTTDLKPETITAADGTVYELVPTKTEGTETGNLAKGETVVTYVYKKVETGSVTVKYTDLEGNEISAPVVDTAAGTKAGTAYDTTDNKPNTITTADGKVYELVPNLTKGNETGTVTNGETVVTYIYREVTPAVATGDVIVHYKDVEGNAIKTSVLDTNNANVGTGYDTTDNKPETIITTDGSKYVLVPSKTKGAETGDVVEGVTEVTYFYQKVANWIPQIPGVPTEDLPQIPYPFDPTTPDQPVVPGDGQVIPYVPGYTPEDPNTGEPLKPVDPEDPSKGYIPPTTNTPGVDTPIPYVKDETPAPATGNVEVKYINTAGETIKATVTDTAGAAVGTAYDTTDNKPESIMLADGTRYVLVPSKTRGAETGEVVEGTTTVTYVYQKVANWIPEIPGVPVDERPVIPYPFDPTNPDQPVTPTPDTVIPYVPGYTPEDPNTGEPLKPVDPEDPSKGYIPPTTNTPGKDTPIPYVKNEEPPVEVKTGNVVVHFQDTEGNTLKSSTTLVSDSPVGGKYNTTGTKAEEIITADGTRYVLVPTKTIGSETGEVVEGTTEITYIYQKVANWIPQIPGVPTEDLPKIPYPFDPNNPDQPVTPTPDTVIPYVPGYTPEDPNTGEPLKPVDPEDPSKGYIPPTTNTPGVDTPIPYVKDEPGTPDAKTGTVKVTYKDVDDNPIPGLNPVTDTKDGAVGTDYSTKDHKVTEVTLEDGTRYVLVPSLTEGAEDGQVVEGETVVTYVYQKVANWIPQLPDVPVEDLPKIPYPFDPSKPGDPIVPGDGNVIPYVPGYTPVDPKTNEPLKPVDPEDPSKGYIPPTTNTPGVDTLIPYIKNDPKDPAPVDPEQPGEPTEPTQPTEPTEPTQPTNPGEPTQPTPVDPTNPADPGLPNQPITPVDPSDPANPGEPTQPTEPTNPGNGGTGGNTGGSTGGNTGGSTGGNTGGSTGGNAGGSTGSTGSSSTTPAPKSTSGSLAHTGAEVGALAGAGALLMGLGAVLTRRGRRKKDSE